MTDSRSQLPRKRSFLAGCLSHLVFSVLVIGLLVGGGYVYLQNYLQQYIGEIPTGTVTQVDTSQKQSIKVAVNRETTNLMLSRFIGQTPEIDFSIKWEEDYLLGETTVHYNGMNLPVEIKADLIVAEGGFFQIVIDSVKLAEIPLPSETAYELVASQLVLPEWLIFNNDQPVIDVDLNRIPIEQSNILLTAAKADLANDEITLEVHYDAENFDLLSSLQFGQ
ncbi:DUF2140 family protein [Fundicoccus sp. Sow4_D5]|uniref:DUF2140 family protein n=1 Tax=unclassified Fundicoccus TaxID=2761543 RepID=UPI003F8EA108